MRYLLNAVHRPSGVTASMTTSQKETSPNEAALPLVTKFLAYLLSPLFFGLAAYELWLIVSNSKFGSAVMFTNTLTVFVACALVFVVCVALVAYQMADYRASKISMVREMGLRQRLVYQEELMRLIVDGLPIVIFISDLEGRLWFANKEAGVFFKSDPEDIIGKMLERHLPPRRASLLLERIARTHKAGVPLITVDRIDEGSGVQYIQTHLMPLEDTSELHRAVMVTMRDVTDSIVERERQELIFKQLVDTLIAVVDRRDPYAAGHSLRVGLVAHAIATEMDLDPQNVEACSIAGSVMNLGKIMVPRNILMKSTALNAEELQLVRKSILASADILSLISFQVPVISTLRQVLERFDGTGEPNKRKGENILLTARIVAVANAFIALVSPRAHRAGLAVEDALGILRAETGRAFDGKVVEALARYIEKNPKEKASLIEIPPEMANAPKSAFALSE